MVSPQDPNPTTISETTTTGRGFVTPEEGRAVVYQQPQFMQAYRSTISWGAVIAGSILAMAFLLFSGELAYACGVPAYAGGSYGWGAGIWSIVTAAAVYYCAGCASAYLCGPANRWAGTEVNVGRSGRYDFIVAYGPMLHGVMAWCLSLPLIVWFFGGWGQMGQLGHIAQGVLTTVNGGLGMETTWNTQTGAAWGSWLSMLCGLVFSAIGGASVWPRSSSES